MPAYLAKAIASATWAFIALFACAAFGIALNIATVGKAADESEGTAIARSLTAMLSAGLIVISNNQELIDNPEIGDKGLDERAFSNRRRRSFERQPALIR